MPLRSIFLAASICALVGFPSAADASTLPTSASLEDSCIAEATLTNSETGKSIEIPLHHCLTHVASDRVETPPNKGSAPDTHTERRNDLQSFTASQEITVNIEDLESIAEAPSTMGRGGSVSPLSIIGGSNTKGVVVARLNIDYDLAGQNVRVNRYYGTLTQSYPTTYFEKSLDGGDGIGFGHHSIHRANIPSSFSYSTGWGYVEKGVGSLAPAGHLTVRFAPDGMAQTTLEVHVSIP